MKTLSTIFLVLLCVSTSSIFAQPINDAQLNTVAHACKADSHLVRTTIIHFLGSKREKDVIVEQQAGLKALEDYIKAHGGSRAEDVRLHGYRERIRLLECMTERNLTLANLRSASKRAASKSAVQSVAPVRGKAQLTEAASVTPEGCKFSFSIPVMEGRRDHWVGDCENGFAEGKGVWLIDDVPDGKLRAFYHVTMRGGTITERHNSYSRGESGVVYQTGDRDGRTTLEQLPGHIRNYFDRGEIPSKETVAAAPAPIVAPPGTELIDAGACKIFYKKFETDRSWRWQGNCVSGIAGELADGEGLLEVLRANERFIQKVAAVRGIIPSSGETYSINDQGGTATWSWTERKWTRVPRDQIAHWARTFIDAHPVIGAAENEQEAEYRRALEERREAREAAREARRQREERDREYDNTMNAIQEQARMLRRQQDEQHARRQAERERIERDNERYRQMQAEQQRPSAAQGGPCPDPTQVRLVTGVCYGDGRKLDTNPTFRTDDNRPFPVHTRPRPGQR